jgi:voltage-gated potassium channel
VLFEQKLEFYLHNRETSISKVVNFTIVALVLLSSSIFVAETYKISASMRSLLNTIDAGITSIFIIEYLVRFGSATNKLKYIFSFYSIIDILAILPSFIGVVDIRFIRLLRWLRILRLIRFFDRKILLSLISSEDGRIFAQILFTLFAIIFVYSGLIYQVEHPVNPLFATFLDAFYFSVVTMTTVGFGDITPISELGRLMTVLMILTGIALIPWQVGDLIRRLVKTTNQKETLCPSCSLSFHDNDAEFCKVCGTKLQKT